MAVTTVDVRKARGAAAARRVAAAMARDGTAAVEGLFPRPLLERMRREVLRRHESGELRARGLIRDVAGRYAAVLPFEGPFLEPRFYANPALHAMLGALLGPAYCIGSLETVIALPGAYDQHQHIDGPVRFDRALGGRLKPYPSALSDAPPYAVTLCVPLVDMTEDNGPTAIWAGSHREALRPRPPGAREIARRFREERMTGPVGRCFFFDYRVFHGGTANQTSEVRPVVMFVFTRAWFRDPNLSEVYPRVVISPRALARVRPSMKPLFALSNAARRQLWPGR